MFTEKDKFRFHIEEYLQKYGPRRCALYLWLYMQNKIINEAGVAEMAARLNLILTGMLSVEVMYRYIFNGWHIKHHEWFPEKLRSFYAVQRIADLLLNEKAILAAEKESYFYEQIALVPNSGPEFEFAMEFCMPTPRMPYFVDKHFNIEEISFYCVVDPVFVEQRFEMHDLDETTLQEIGEDFERRTGHSVTFRMGVHPWGVYYDEEAE